MRVMLSLEHTRVRHTHGKGLRLLGNLRDLHRSLEMLESLLSWVTYSPCRHLVHDHYLLLLLLLLHVCLPGSIGVDLVLEAWDICLALFRHLLRLEQEFLLVLLLNALGKYD